MQRHKYLQQLLLLLLVCCYHLTAHAGFKFGDSEQLRFISEVRLQGPEGEPLYLARKIVQHNFLLPYSAEDRGYVLAVSGAGGRYFPISEPEMLSTWQSLGKVPTPLPPYEPSLLDYFSDHSLWLTLTVLLSYVMYVRMPYRSVPAAMHWQASQTSSRLFTPCVPQPNARDVNLPLTLYPASRKLAMILALAIYFIALGLFLYQDLPVLAVAVIAFGSKLGYVYAPLLLPGRHYFTLTHEHLTIATWRSKRTLAWHDLDKIGILRFRRYSILAWTYSASFSGKRPDKMIFDFYGGFDVYLSVMYGMKSEELAQMMAEIHASAIAQKKQGTSA